MGNPMRLTGLATGMDTENTIKQLMKPYNMKVDKMKQEKQTMQWKQEIIRDMIKELRELDNNYLSMGAPDATNMFKSSTFSVATITSSNDGVLTATALPGATAIPSNVVVKSVAKPASIDVKLEKNPTSTITNITSETKMSDVGFNKGANFEIVYGADTFSIEVQDNETVQQFVNRLNSVKGSKSNEALFEKAQVSFAELTGKITIETRNTGDKEKLDLTLKKDPTTTETKSGVGKLSEVEITAKDGSIVKVNKPGNEFTIDNVTYSINSGYVVNSATQSVSLAAKADAQKSVDKIKGFVDKYNAIVDKMYSKYTEKKQYKFNPLTEEQRKEMKEDEIKKWDAKAKEGIIKGDESIGSMLTAMRSAIFDKVEGAGISLKDIGLDSFSGIESTLKPGQIKLDTAKLKNALETRGDQVMKLFSGSPDKALVDDKTMDPKVKARKIYESTGAFKRLDDILYNYVGKTDAILLNRVGIEGTFSYGKNDLTDKLKKKDTLIAQMEKKMATQEERYYKKFAQLEKAMNMFNSQSSWLTSQLGGGK